MEELNRLKRFNNEVKEELNKVCKARACEHCRYQDICIKITNLTNEVQLLINTKQGGKQE